tara:strand:- start:9019 stop:9210 length:192 start_codon:yes stop_codon:yes gene_type:complete
MEKLTLKLFWIFMVACASFAITGIWLENLLPEVWFKVMGTFFIIGLANFLVWSPLIAYRFLNK